IHKRPLRVTFASFTLHAVEKVDRMRRWEGSLSSYPRGIAVTSTKLIVVALATILMTTVPGSTQEPDVTGAEKRLEAALKLAHANEASAIPVLIDLLPILPVRQREKAEEFLLELAGEWAPIRGPMGTDETSLRIRKAAWAAWWANVDGPALLGALRKHTLT